MQSRVVGAHLAQEAHGEEEEAFGRLVVPSSVQVGSVLEHAEHPLERVGQLVPAPHRVEEGEDVEADDGVGARPFGVKVGLPEI